MLKIVLKEPVPHAYQKKGDLARSMQVFIVEGDEVTFEALVVGKEGETLPMKDTWYSFIRIDNGVKLFIPAMNVAWVEEVSVNASRQVS